MKISGNALRRAGWRAGLLLICVIVSAADSDPSSFKGKPITIYVGSGPGGGYDLFGRLISRHLARFLPGAPSVVAQNMPGAGSITAANYLFNSAPRDGTALAVVTPSLALLDLLGAPGVRFHAASYGWVGRVASIVNVTFTMAASKVKTIADARESAALIATIADASPLTILTRVMNKTAGTRFRIIGGYADSNATLLAAERGEADGSTVSWNTLNSMKHDWLVNKKINILVQYANERHAHLLNTPAAVELAQSERDRQIIALYVNSADVGYSLLAPPGLPPPRLQALRTAFDAMTRDQLFLDDARRMDAELDPLTGARLQALVEAVARTPASVREAARQAAGH